MKDGSAMSQGAMSQGAAHIPENSVNRDRNPSHKDSISHRNSEGQRRGACDRDFTRFCGVLAIIMPRVTGTFYALVMAVGPKLKLDPGRCGIQMVEMRGQNLRK